jgi:hypothetical protein
MDAAEKEYPREGSKNMLKSFLGDREVKGSGIGRKW